MNGSNFGEKHGRSTASLRYEGTVWSGFDFEEKDIGSIALIEDEEYPGEGSLAVRGFENDDLVDARFEQGTMLAGHGCSLPV
jgi:hypothetical protein